MKYIAPNHSVKISKTSAPYEQRENFISVRYQGPFVILMIGNRPIPMSTVQAHKIGFPMLRTADDCIRQAHNGVLWDGFASKESVVLTVNGHSMHISPVKASKIADALLRKSDPADDFQRKHNTRMITI